MTAITITPDKIRNLAIIAHIDHGKTTLIDSIFKAAQTFRGNARVQERVMDNNALEKERGITIRAKQCAVHWKEYLINIVDTPGHADFSGEVERVLSMVDSVLLLVDANEGPMPQTRYVLMRALALGLRPIVIVNKVDRPQAEPQRVLDQTFDLFIELGANDQQVEFPVLYGSGLNGWMVRDMENQKHEGMDDLFQTIIDYVPAPEADLDAPFQMQVTAIGYNDFIGRLGCGRVMKGRIKRGEMVNRTTVDWTNQEEGEWEIKHQTREKVVHLWRMDGTDRVDADHVAAGDICWFAGPSEINIGEIFSHLDMENPGMKPLEIEEPTVSMLFLVNTSPFAGQDGQAITLRQLKNRLDKELKENVALRMEDIGRSDGVKVSGRGELHLGILIEEMRREGMEFCVSPPEVITRTSAQGKLEEPFEKAVIDVPEDHQGVVIEKMARRKGEMVNMSTNGRGIVRMEFVIPTRGLIGYRSEFLTDTRGLGIMAARFNGYAPWAGVIESRGCGSMISMETGEATTYALESIQVRGTLFVGPMEMVYAGMVIGENSRPDDLECNPCKKKHVTNHRSANKEIDAKLDVPRRLSLDQSMEWIARDELLEVTPKTVRIRKMILDVNARRKEGKRLASS